MKYSNEIKTTLSSISTGEIKRKDLIKLFADQGIEEKFTYPFLLPENRGTGRGTYDVAKCLETALIKAGEVIAEPSAEPLKKVAKKATKPVAKKTSKKASKKVDSLDDDLDRDTTECVAEWIAPEVSGRRFGKEAVDAVLDYTQDDIDDELSLMNTSL